MNRNIEIITLKLWAVKFSWLPWITDFSVQPDPSGYPLEKEMMRNLDGGIMLLNSDYKHYDFVRNGFIALQKYSLKRLNRIWEFANEIPNKTELQLIKQAMVARELERRKMKGGKR